MTIDQLIKISRDEAADQRLLSMHYTHLENYHAKLKHDELANKADNLDQLADWLEELKKLREDARPTGEWVSVSERLPEDMQRVLIWFEYYRYGDFNCMYQTYGFGYVCDGKWSPFINGETGWQDYKVIAWQPLPEPYNKGGAE